VEPHLLGSRRRRTNESLLDPRGPSARSSLRTSCMGLLRGLLRGSAGSGRSGLLVGAVVLGIRLGSGRRGRRVGGSSRTGGSGTGAAGDERGAGEGVLEAGVEDLGGVDAGVGSGVRARELGELSTRGLDRSSTASHAQLEAARVKLGTALAIGKMKSDDLVAHDVVTVLEALGDGDSVLGSERHELGYSPTLAYLSGLLNLEKVALGRVELVGGLTSGNLGHVGDKRTHLMGPLLVRVSDPGQVEIGASSRRSDHRSGLGIGTTGDSSSARLLVRVDGRDATDRRLGVRLPRDGTVVSLAVYGNERDITVGVDTDSSQGEKGHERREQHFGKDSVVNSSRECRRN